MPILWRTLGESPRQSRWLVAFLVTLTVTLIGIEAIDNRGAGASLAVPLELLAIVLGTGGALVIALAHLLHTASQADSSCSGRGLQFEAGRLHQMLLALPALGLLGCVLLAASSGIIAARAVQKESAVLLVASLLYAGVIVFASRTVTRTTRFLYGQARAQAEAAAAARAEASEAQLATLQAQMNPHFLFNALNTVASLVQSDPAAAERTVEGLAGVLRRTLHRSSFALRTVGDELDYLAAYLAVEQQRWGDRLRVSWTIDPETRSLALPPMTLQPLVENALRHGLGERIDGGELAIITQRRGSRLRLAVSDDGAGFPTVRSEGTGLGNLRQRLATLFGEQASIEIDSVAGRTTVTVELPAETLAAGMMSRP